MKKVLVIILATLLILLSACGKKEDTTSDIYDQLPSDGDDAATSGMVDEVYFLTGELKEISQNSILIDDEDISLVRVRFDQEVNLDIPVKSIVKVQFTGDIAESYPAQVYGLTLEVVELFSEEAIYTKEEIDTMLADGDVNHVIAWNKTKDYVAYATIDMETFDGSYKIYVSNIYEKGYIEVAYVKYEIPDLNWINNKLEIQTSSDSYEIGPDFSIIKDIIETEGKSVKEDTGISYELDLMVYEDYDKNISIEYFHMTRLSGELIQDYINQTLYNIVDIYGNDYTNIQIKAEILKEDNFLTIAYNGENTEMDYDIERHVTIDVATSEILTIENVIGDVARFKEIFENESGFVYDEQEGVSVYIVDFDLYVTFVPTDDMADRVTFSLLLDQLAPVLDMQFEKPAS